MKVRAVLSFLGVCFVLLFAGVGAQAGSPPSEYISRTPKLVGYEKAPVLRLSDSSGKLRWQLPVALWHYLDKDLGGCPYPIGVTPDKPLSLKGSIVFAGYGLTREGWDDYQGQRVDGCIVVLFTGVPQLKTPIDRSEPTDFGAWTRLIQEKVNNAKAHGAVGVWLERSPLAPPSAAKANFQPKSVPSFLGGIISDPASLPVFSIGADTLEVVTGLTSDPSQGQSTTLTPLGDLLPEAESKGTGLGPLVLPVSGELSWDGVRLEKKEGPRGTLWYQPRTPAARDSDAIAKSYEGTLRNLETLLSVRLDGRVTILLFDDWHSKLFCTHTVGRGGSDKLWMTMVYEGAGDDRATLVHELCHIVTDTMAHPPACFQEGLARLVGDALGDLQSVSRGRVAADDTTAANLREGKLWTLPQLLALPDIGSEKTNSVVAYPEAASFCAFLIRQIGFNSFRTLYQTLPNDDPGKAASQIERATGRSLAQLESDWHAYLEGEKRP